MLTKFEPEKNEQRGLCKIWFAPLYFCLHCPHPHHTLYTYRVNYTNSCISIKVFECDSDKRYIMLLLIVHTAVTQVIFYCIIKHYRLMYGVFVSS